MLKLMIKKLLLYYFNKRKKSKIKSINVSLKSNIDKLVEIGSYTHIDDFCDIGSYTYIGRNCSITKSKIGRYCSIGNNVSIGQGEHDLNKVSTSSLFYDSPYEELTKEECIIENDVWIGVDSIILRGVRIGTGAVVGANSVVTKDVPPFSIVAGVPSKIIRYRFDEAKIVKIEQSKWWEKDLKSAKKIIEGLENE